MGLFKKRRYYFTDSSFALDTIISYCMAGVSLAIELAAVIASIKTKGHVPDVFGMLFVVAILLSVVGEAFAWFGMQEQKGGVRGKRVSVALNLVSLAIPIIIIIFGLVGL